MAKAEQNLSNILNDPMNLVFMKLGAGAGSLAIRTGKEVIESGGTFPSQKGNVFASEEKLLNHFEKHGSDFGSNNPEQYAAMAHSFLTQKSNPNILEKFRTNGDIVKYNPSTNEFGVVSNDGVVRTYYKPNPSVHGMKSNLDYFNAQ